jgi:hypothetical protein
MKTGGPTEAQIRERAYEIFLERGRRPGHEVDDWLEAEYELMQLPIRKIAELSPPENGSKISRRPSLVRLVQAALLVGAETLPHLRR